MSAGGVQSASNPDPLRETTRYVKVADLSHGSFGFVQLARNTETQELVAIKFIERGDRVNRCVLLRCACRDTGLRRVPPRSFVGRTAAVTGTAGIPAQSSGCCYVAWRCMAAHTYPPSRVPTPLLSRCLPATAAAVTNRYVEAEILNHRMLRHPHVIEFREVFITSEYICIAMEFASGGSLFT